MLPLLIGCGNDPPETRTPVADPAATISSNEHERSGAVRPLPARGVATLRYENGTVSVDAFEAPRRPLLDRLANDAGFTLVAEASDWPPLTLRIDQMPLELALPLLVGDLEYVADWQTEKGVHRLEKLAVGPVTRSRAPLDEADDAVTEGEVTATLDRALAAINEAPPSAADSAAQAERFADADPEERVRAALALEPEGEGLKTLCDMLANDPDPRVRAATTASLENSEDFAAVRALVEALRDPNAEVVVEVIDSLEFAADASIVPDLEKLLAHADPRVRQRAADAIEFFGR